MTDLDEFKKVLDEQQTELGEQRTNKVAYEVKENPTNPHLLDLTIDSAKMGFIFIKDTGKFFGLYNYK